MAKNFSKISGGHQTTDQKIQRKSTRINTKNKKKITPLHPAILYSSCRKSKERENPEIILRKNHLMYREAVVRITTDCYSETMLVE